MNTNGRTVVVATSKSDWPHSVTDESDLYAHTISKAYDSHLKNLPPLSSIESASSVVTTPQKNNQRRCVENIQGMGDGLNREGNERLQNLTVLCGSQRTFECEEDPLVEKGESESVMVFPDYKLVANLPNGNAKQLVADHLSPRILGPFYPSI